MKTKGSYHGNMDIPGYGSWRDNGCKSHPSCLNCPELRCLEELSHSHDHGNKQFDKVRQYVQEGRTMVEICDLMKLSERQVKRYLSKL
jgi:hypothetical protein